MTRYDLIKILSRETPGITNSTKLLPDSYMDVEEAMTHLVEITGVFDGRKQNYRLVFGTLLGLYRDGHLIEHDHDIDIAFDSADIGGLYDCIKILRGMGYAILRLEDRIISLGCSSCYVDLYLYDHVSPDLLTMGNCELTPGDFTTETTVECKGKQLKTVADPEYFCRKYYGICWRTRTKGARATPHQVGQSRSQYGEDKFFFEYFGSEAGFVVDVAVFLTFVPVKFISPVK